MNQVFLQLGSNLGEREHLLFSATTLINDKIGNVVSKSKVYESTPWRVEGQENYLNQIVKIDTEFTPELTLQFALEIEEKLGRVRIEKWGERLIDIDIIFFNDEIIETSDLCIPHKHMHERNFVLEPLNEIASDYMHPKYKKTIAELLEQSKDAEKVEEYAI
jgi:2-amino-4-hydroxy-6-hydroxymethyldihydropteridine diphosphokinase